jgi:hypothetical protein
VTGRDREQRGTARETTDDGSRRSAVLTGVFRGATPLAIGIAAAGLVAAILLVATEFSTVASVDVANTSCEVIQDSDPELADRCELSGFERQPFLRTLLAVGIAAMALGAGLGGARPAAVALVVLGALTLGLALFLDLPVTRETGALGTSFEGARGQAGIGLTFELLAGALAIAAGASRLLARDARDSATGGRISPRRRSPPRD